MKNLLIAVNSFKECASSTYITSTYKKLFKKDYNVFAHPMTDGGDGFLVVCKDRFKLQILTFKILNSFNNAELKVDVGYDKISKTLYLESADVIGLKLLNKNYRNAAVLNSENLGELFLKIIDKIIQEGIIVNKLIIGVGGTAVTDLGAGMMRILGMNYLSKGIILKELKPVNFVLIDDVDVIYENLPFEIELVIDVDNPLLGNNGAVRVFGKQKGLDKYQMDLVEKGFVNLISLYEQNGFKIKKEKLSGAGGGIAAALQIFFKAKTISAEEFIMHKINLTEIKDKIDYVVTGEGKFDNQSVNNKVTGIIMKNFKNAEKIFLCCGQIDKASKNLLPKNVDAIDFLKFHENVENSMKNIDLSLKKSADLIINRKK
ncbi:MAG TPA: glycerate kinase [Ignavibacteriaceae bacterium]|nr:glycerate kinase [Ignavibacteriaceae bacterium]